MSSTFTPGTFSLRPPPLSPKRAEPEFPGARRKRLGHATRQRANGLDAIGEAIALEVALEQHVMLFHGLDRNHPSRCTNCLGDGNGVRPDVGPHVDRGVAGPEQRQQKGKIGSLMRAVVVELLGDQITGETLE